MRAKRAMVSPQTHPLLIPVCINLPSFYSMATNHPSNGRIGTNNKQPTKWALSLTMPHFLARLQKWGDSKPPPHAFGKITFSTTTSATHDRRQTAGDQPQRPKLRRSHFPSRHLLRRNITKPTDPSAWHRFAPTRSPTPGVSGSGVAEMQPP
jgi:hypothetical protein